MSLGDSWRRGPRDEKAMIAKAKDKVQAKFEAERTALLEAHKHELFVISRDLALGTGALQDRMPHERDVQRQTAERVAIARRIDEEQKRRSKLVNRVVRRIRGDDGKLAAIEAQGARRMKALDAEVKASTEQRHLNLIERTNRYARELQDAKMRHAAEVEEQKKQQALRFELEVARQVKHTRERGRTH